MFLKVIRIPFRNERKSISLKLSIFYFFHCFFFSSIPLMMTMVKWFCCRDEKIQFYLDLGFSVDEWYLVELWANVLEWVRIYGLKLITNWTHFIYLWSEMRSFTNSEKQRECHSAQKITFRTHSFSSVNEVGNQVVKAILLFSYILDDSTSCCEMSEKFTTHRQRQQQWE